MSSAEVLYKSSVSAVAAATPQRKLSLKTNFAWTFLGTAIYAACNWGILAVLAKQGGSAVLGQYALGVAIVTPVLMLSNVNLRAVLATDVTGRNRFGEYLDLRYLSTLLALVVIAIVVGLQHSQFELCVVVMLVGFVQAVEAISDIHWGRLQRAERMRQISVSMIARGALSVSALAIALFLSGRLIYALMAVILARLAVLCAFDVPQSRQLLPFEATPEHVEETLKVAAQKRANLLWLAFPLGLVLMFSSLAQNIPTYFIKNYGGIADVGLYAAISSFLSVGTAVINALGQSATPRLAKLYAARELRLFRVLVLKLAAVGLAVGLSGVVTAYFAGPLVLRLMYRPEFARHASVLVAVMLSSIFVYVGMLMGYASTAAQAFRPQAPLFAIVAGVSATASFLLVRSHGLVGAAMSIGVAGAVHMAGECFILLRALCKRQRETSC